MLHFIQGLIQWRNYKCSLQVWPLLWQVHTNLNSKKSLLRLVLFYGIQFSQVEALHAHSAIVNSTLVASLLNWPQMYWKAVSKHMAQRFAGLVPEMSADPAHTHISAPPLLPWYKPPLQGRERGIVRDVQTEATTQRILYFFIWDRRFLLLWRALRRCVGSVRI